MRFNKIVHRRRKDAEVATARVAIRNHCIECMGGEKTAVAGCTAPKCWLYPWRTGTPDEYRMKLSEAVRARRSKNLKALGKTD